MISIEGRLLENVWHHLCASKESFIRAKADGERRKITVEPIKLKGYSPEK